MVDHPGFQFVGSRDPITGEVDLVGELPGPAGVATVSLLGGDATLVVDVADPGRFCRLITPPEVSGLLPLLDALSGGNGRRVAARIGVLAERPEIVDRPRTRFVPPATDPDDPITGVFVRLGRMALIQSDLESFEGPGIDRITDRLRFVHHGLALPAGLAVSPAPGEVLDDTIDRLVELLDRGIRTTPAEITMDAGDGIDEPSGPVGLLEALADTTGRDDPDRAERLRTLARRVGGPPRSATPPDDPPTPSPPSRYAADGGPADWTDGQGSLEITYAAASDSLDFDTEVIGFPTRHRFDVEAGVVGMVDVTATAAIHDGGELTVTIEHASFPDDAGHDGRDAPCWLRVYRVPRRRGAHQPPLLVALAPFLRSGVTGTMTAIALLPSGEEPGRLVAEVTARGDLTWQSHPEQLVRYAVTLGQSAARSSRRGDFHRAAERWLATARAWGWCDDERRARLATEHASGERRFTNVPSLDW